MGLGTLGGLDVGVDLSAGDLGGLDAGLGLLGLAAGLLHAEADLHVFGNAASYPSLDYAGGGQRGVCGLASRCRHIGVANDDCVSHIFVFQHIGDWIRLTA